MITDDIQAIRDRFYDVMEADFPDMVALNDNDASEEIPADKVWCRFSVRPGSKVVAESGPNPRYQQLGLAILQVFVPQNMGDTLGWQFAEAIDTAFRAWRSDDRFVTVYQTGFETYPANPNQIGKNPTAPFHQINLTILWKSLRP